MATDWTKGLGRTTSPGRRRDTAILLVLALLGACIASGARLYYAARFNREAVAADGHGRHADAVRLYTRSLQLVDREADIHANLARSLEVIGDYDRAASEYREAILLSSKTPYASLIRLARLALLRRSDANEALRLLNAAQEELGNALKSPGAPAPAREAELQYAIHKYRAWALITIKSAAAPAEIAAARRLDPDAAAPDCLTVEWLMASDRPAEAAVAAAECVRPRSGKSSGTDVEPVWLEKARALAKEK